MHAFDLILSHAVVLMPGQLLVDDFSAFTTHYMNPRGTHAFCFNYVWDKSYNTDSTE